MLRHDSIHPSWMSALSAEFDKPYFKKLTAFLTSEADSGVSIFPHSDDVFTALQLTPLNRVRVVILGQDPYHGRQQAHVQAHGLSFSVQDNIKPPPSLVNMYKELNSDLGIPIAQTGCLNHWATQGVLLLNSVLTVREDEPNSHKGKGWETFTDRVIQLINDELSGVVFLLWGKSAQQKASQVDGDKHLILTAPHPSPLSAYRGFFGCQHFSKTNDYLIQRQKAPIDWALT
ncbi:MAG: uracil-DNA glycosylase [Pseudomonadota bacterium]